MPAAALLGIMMLLGIVCARPVGAAAAASAVTATHSTGGDMRDSTARKAKIAQSLIGVWQMQGNEAFTRSFNSDGTSTDQYQGDLAATVSGTWRLYTSADRVPGFDRLLPGRIYLWIQQPRDTLLFQVVRSDARELWIRYADRGGHLLKFTRRRSD